MENKVLYYDKLNDRERYEYRLLYQLRYNRRKIIDDKFLKYYYDIPDYLKSSPDFISFVSDPFYPIMYYDDTKKSKKYFKYFKKTIANNINLLISFLVDNYQFKKSDFNYSLESFYKIWAVVIDNLEVSNKSDLEKQLESRLGYKNRNAMMKAIPKSELDDLAIPSYYCIHFKTYLGNTHELSYLWQSIVFYLTFYYVKCLQRKFKASRWKIDKKENSGFSTDYLKPIIKLNFGYSEFYTMLSGIAIDAHLSEKGREISFESFNDLLEKI